MAYKLADDTGPFPNKAGEFCGNYNKFCRSCDYQETKIQHEIWLAKMHSVVLDLVWLELLKKWKHVALLVYT